MTATMTLIEAPVRELAFFVPGHPETAGSKTAFVIPKTRRAVVTESGDAASKARKRSWRGDLRDAAAAADDPLSGWAEGCPLEVVFVEVRKRPSAHLTTGRTAGLVKDWARPLRPVTRPDALKVARAAEDALTGVLWPDDAQIVSERLEKAYGDQVGLTPRSEGLIVMVRDARAYDGPMANALPSDSPSANLAQRT